MEAGSQRAEARPERAEARPERAEAGQRPCKAHEAADGRSCICSGDFSGHGSQGGCGCGGGRIRRIGDGNAKWRPRRTQSWRQGHRARLLQRQRNPERVQMAHQRAWQRLWRGARLRTARHSRRASVTSVCRALHLRALLLRWWHLRSRVLKLRLRLRLARQKWLWLRLLLL